MNFPDMAQLSREPPARPPHPGATTDHQPTNQLGGAMTYTDRYTALTTQRAYARRGLAALLAPYTVRPAGVIPAQRRRVVRTEVRA